MRDVIIEALMRGFELEGVRRVKEFERQKALHLKAVKGSPLTRAEKRVDRIMRKHLAGFMGVISHGTWRDLRASLAKLVH